MLAVRTFLALALAAGARAAPAPRRVQALRAWRAPAAAPRPALAAAAASAEAARRSFRAMPKAAAATLEKAYDDGMLSYFRPGGGGLERAYGERWERDDEHARAMVRLGFRADLDAEGRAVLLPPEDLSEIVARFAGQARRLMAEGRLREEDAIIPALELYRDDPTGGPQQLVYVRPGFDPWPEGEGWELAWSGHQFPAAEYHRHLAAGRFVLNFGGMLIHDLAHLTEFHEHPEIMASARAFSRARADDPWADGYETPDKLREWLHAEAASIPDVRRAASIRGLLPHWFSGPGRVRSLAEARTRLERMTPAERGRHVRRLLDAAPSLLARHGGGMRDHYSLNRFAERDGELGLDAVGVLHDGSDPREWNPRDPATWSHPARPLPPWARLLRETPHALLLEIEALWNVRHGHGPGGEADPRWAGADVPLSDRAARLETALAAAVRLGLTPEDLFRDARLRAPARGSKTARYFLSGFLPRDSQTLRALGLAP